MIIYVFLFLGMLVYLLLDIATFRKALPTTDLLDVIINYFKLNSLYILAGAGIGIVATYMLQTGELQFLTQLGFTFGSESGKIGSAFLFGLLNQWLLLKVRKFTNSVIAETTTTNDVVTKDTRL